ncbi:site-2 protease family protein [bacterium]|nr:site-2 protease family protein [bacterium]
MDFTSQVLAFFFIFMSIVIHEISHGYAAYLLGDDTAKRMGRLSLNPLHHVDIFGTIILPIILVMTAGFAFGYAKPVPINPYNFKNYKKGMGITGAAGPLANFAITFLLAILYVILAKSGFNQDLRAFEVIKLTMQVNIFLALFNLIPVPPLDGSRIVGAFLSDEAYIKYSKLERYGMYIILGALVVGSLLNISIIGLIINRPFQIVWGFFAQIINALL